jgi:transcription initiation factor IIF auxiliary subunit
MNIRQDSTYVDQDWWRWSVELDGSADELDQVQYVIYELHPTFPQPVRRVTDRSKRFRLEAEGWGEFTIHARVVTNTGKEEHLEHELQLHYPGGQRTAN